MFIFLKGSFFGGATVINLPALPVMKQTDIW